MTSAVATRKRAGFSATARQRRMGPAPFASFEDVSAMSQRSPHASPSHRAVSHGSFSFTVSVTFQDLSDDLEDSPPEEARPQLPGIAEDASPAVPTSNTVTSTLNVASGGLTVSGLHTPSTPRIDISRASSSSHHEEEEDSGESRSSTPERELFAGQGGLGFKEEGAAELRSSTEELDFHEDAQERERRRERLQRRKERGRGSMQPVFKYELEAQSEKERKDSACSLPVSGRTSRLSSVGSAASGASSGASALSVGSRALSAVSAATSRSPSPHRMLLETSFCGSKPIPTQSIDLDSPCKHETESLEKVLLSRQTDPTKVVMAVECTPTSPGPPVSPSIKPATLNLAGSGTKVVQSFPAVVHNIPDTAPSPEPVLQREEELPCVSESVKHISVVEPVSEPVVVENEVCVTATPPVLHEAPSCASPKPSRHHVALRKAAEETRSEIGSRTPSPSTSRKSSFTNLFRKTDSPLTPDSPTAKRKNVFTTKLKEASDGLRERSRSRSKSNERNHSVVVVDGKTKKDSKNKSVFSSLFKKKSKRPGSSGSGEDTSSPQESTTMSPEDNTKLTDAIGNVEFTFASEPLADRRSVIHERVVSEDREEREAARELEDLPPEIPAKPSESARLGNTAPLVSEPQVSIPQKTDTLVADAKIDVMPTSSMQYLGDKLDRADSSDSEMDRSRDESVGKIVEALHAELEQDHERKTLVMQDSFDDELPYVPTTLPQERSMVVPIVPVRQRLCPEVCAIERPRSTTPINPANLEEFVQSVPTGNTPPPESERLRISLPREDSLTSSRPLKSPRRLPGAKSWVEFAETSIRSEARRPSVPSPVSPPPLPPRASPPSMTTPPPLPPVKSSTTPPPAKSWVNFEEIPERRKPPKKIQTIPSRGPVREAREVDGAGNIAYVNPEDCRCECHAAGHGASRHVTRQEVTSEVVTRLDVSAESRAADRSSIMSDSSYDFAANPYCNQGAQGTSAGGLKPMKPFGMDLDVHSNRSSIISQDEGGSPESPPSHGGM